MRGSGVRKAIEAVPGAVVDDVRIERPASPDVRLIVAIHALLLALLLRRVRL